MKKAYIVKTNMSGDRLEPYEFILVTDKDEKDMYHVFEWYKNTNTELELYYEEKPNERLCWIRGMDRNLVCNIIYR